ncbi:MAG TPA: type II toxin-antitoxin system HicB family antitoxin [Streptosporangiaceae bacterium]
MADMKTYRAELERDGRFWRVRVPDIDRTTQARNLSEAEAMARDLIAIMADVPQNSFDVDMKIMLPEDVQLELDQSIALREQAKQSQAEAARLSRDAAQRLHNLGLSLRDIGRALGVTFQRAKQLVDEAGQPGRQNRV